MRCVRLPTTRTTREKSCRSTCTRIARMRTTDKPTKERRLDIKFGESEFRGDEVLTIKELKKSFDGRTLFDHVNLEVIGGERAVYDESLKDGYPEF